MRFAEKVVIVTGGGSGIGRAASIAFAQEGAKVIIADINETDGLETCESIRANKGDAHYQHVDVSSSDSVAQMVNKTVAQHGKLDVYFSNAGVLDGFLGCQDTSDTLWQRVIGVNLSGCFYGARAALPELVKTKGNIVVTASIAGLGAMAGGAAYTASKYGVIGLVNHLACECAESGVRVNAVLPGAVKTNLGRNLPEDPGIDAWIQAVTPMGRWAEPEEIVEGVLYLASEAASYVTGTALRIDGGWRSK